MKERRSGPTPHTTFRTLPEDRRLLDVLSARLGIGQTGVIRLALRTLAQRQGIELTREGADQEHNHNA